MGNTNEKMGHMVGGEYSLKISAPSSIMRVFVEQPRLHYTGFVKKVNMHYQSAAVTITLIAAVSEKLVQVRMAVLP